MNFRFLSLNARMLWLVGVILTAFFLLTGCARYDMSIRFADANHGEIVQSIRLDEELPGIGGTVLNSWLETLQEQAVQLGGSIRHPSPQELRIKIPFYNARDLQNKFNQILYAQTRSTSNDSRIGSQLRIISGNWIIWQRYRLQYDLDLRGLTIPAAAADSATPELNLSLQTPWKAKAIDPTRAPLSRKRGHQLIWRLQPGEINHIEATFWLPSPLGIGTVLIVLLVLGGSYVKTHSAE